MCLSIENVNIGNGTLDIFIENSVEVGGFQFEFLVLLFKEQVEEYQEIKDILSAIQHQLL